MNLEKLQNDFIAAIFNQDRDTALKYIQTDKRLDAKQRLGIYRGSVHAILTQSLGDTFPVTKALLGEEFFDKMCDLFIDKYPPSTPFFSHFGDNLALFLSDFEPVKAISFIADMAAFEWSRHKLWQQLPSQAFDFSQIASLNEEQQTKLIFHLNPTLHLFQSNFRIDLIWFAHQEDNDIELDEIDINADINLLIWKSDNSIKIANFETNTLIENEYISENSFTNKEYWDFLNDVSKAINITELAAKYSEKFPDLLNKGIQDGRIESFTCD